MINNNNNNNNNNDKMYKIHSNSFVNLQIKTFQML